MEQSALRGADNYDSLRGDGLDFMMLDEYASIAAKRGWRFCALL